MRTSISYLEEALEKMGDEPDKRKAERLKLTATALCNYRAGVSRMDNFACIMVGRYLGIDPMKIMAACEEERAKTEEKQEFWRDFRKTLSGLAIAAALGVTTMAAPSPAHAYTVNDGSMTNVYYVKFSTENGLLLPLSSPLSLGYH